eukprot:140037-Chlamydomonas_euryale.AAC.1
MVPLQTGLQGGGTGWPGGTARMCCWCNRCRLARRAIAGGPSQEGTAPSTKGGCDCAQQQRGWDCAQHKKAASCACMETGKAVAREAELKRHSSVSPLTQERGGKSLAAVCGCPIGTLSSI